MVDFKILHDSLVRSFAKKIRDAPYAIKSYPSISQRTFLENLGIDARLMKLLTSSAASAPDDVTRDRHAKNLTASFNRLVEEMGDEYQVYCFSSDDVSIGEYVA